MQNYNTISFSDLLLVPIIQKLTFHYKKLLLTSSHFLI